MADSWESVCKSAMKVLGDKGKIPKYSTAVPKTSGAVDKAYDDYKKSRDDLKAKVLALQNADDAYRNAVSQFQDTIDEDDLGLDRKNKDEAKKIDEAQKILSKHLQEQMDIADGNVKNLKELDRHLMSLSNYKR